ncbi:hypothetical protein LJB83_02525, partial [Clostridia bacterium OttesenSCG-928-F22]|nr:hypothetical protein [Clostridia bacterium OttesenSCG-928-F22]
GLVVYPKIIEKRLNEELPFMATETILMEAVRRGGDRQDLHEKIRVYSMEAGARVKQEGKENNLLELIMQDGAFKLSKEEIADIVNPQAFVGRSEQQVEEYIAGYIQPILDDNAADINEKGEVRV